jgi:hypothetical protein
MKILFFFYGINGAVRSTYKEDLVVIPVELTLYYKATHSGPLYMVLIATVLHVL